MKLKIQQTVNDIENNEKKYKREREQKLKKEIEDRIEKANKLQEYNQLLNSFISNHKESFCLISEFLSDYMEEIIRMDTALIKTQEQNIVIPGIDYESLSKKRNKYAIIPNKPRSISNLNQIDSPPRNSSRHPFSSM